MGLESSCEMGFAVGSGLGSETIDLFCDNYEIPSCGRRRGKKKKKKKKKKFNLVEVPSTAAAPEQDVLKSPSAPSDNLGSDQEPYGKPPLRPIKGKWRPASSPLPDRPHSPDVHSPELIPMHSNSDEIHYDDQEHHFHWILAFEVLLDIFPPETVTTCIIEMLYGQDDLATMLIENKAGGVDEEYGSMIASILKHNRTIQKVIIRSCSLGTNNIILISNSLLNNPNVKELHLPYVHMSNPGVVAIANMLKHNSTIQRLYLSGNEFGSHGVKALCEMLRSNSTLTKLKLGKIYHRIDNEARGLLEEINAEREVLVFN